MILPRDDRGICGGGEEAGGVSRIIFPPSPRRASPPSPPQVGVLHARQYLLADQPYRPVEYLVEFVLPKIAQGDGLGLEPPHARLAGLDLAMPDTAENGMRQALDGWPFVLLRMHQRHQRP